MKFSDFVISLSLVLLEGSPGVGKTSLIVALGKFSGHTVVRINLSEQVIKSFGLRPHIFGCSFQMLKYLLRNYVFLWGLDIDIHRRTSWTCLGLIYLLRLMKGCNLHGLMEFSYRCVYIPPVEWLASFKSK